MALDRLVSGTVGALLIGAHTADGRLTYLGHVSSGLTELSEQPRVAVTSNDGSYRHILDGYYSDPVVGPTA